MTRLGHLTLGAVALLVASSAAANEATLAVAPKLPQQGLEVVVESGRLTLRARDARLADVLEAIGRQAGVRILLQRVFDARVTESFVDVPLDEGIRRLGRWHSVVMIYDQSSSVTRNSSLTEIWVMSPSKSELAKAAPGTPRAGGTRADRPVDPRDPISVETALNIMNRETRKQKMDALMREGDQAAVASALREAALTSANGRARYEAIRVLKSMNTVEATDAIRTIVNELRDRATREPDPRLRREAIQVLASLGSPEAVDALEDAVRDRHGSVASEARKALARQRRAGADPAR